MSPPAVAAHGPPPTAQRHWPTPQDYNEAVQNPALNFADPELRRGTPELTPLGLPRAITGGFASVYRLRCGARDWAVRCFLREVPDQQERYAAIGRHLAAAKLPATVGFAFLADGIRVGGRLYPILKMEWVRGEPLDRWIERHLGDPAALRALADRWGVLLRALRRAKVAHGDLQHGNIMVINDELRLIDYDGLYVPALAGRAATEVGHRNYQHPRRDVTDFGPHLDHFAAWSIDLSLRALAIEPGLWGRFVAGDEALLLRREDYERPATSAALAALAALPDPALRALVGRFRALLAHDVSQLPPLDAAEPQRKAPRGLTRVRPARAVAPTPAIGAAAWLADHLPVPPVRRIESSPLPERVGFIVALGLLSAACVLALSGVVAGVAALVFALLASVTVGAALLVRFLSLPSSPGLLVVRLRLVRSGLWVGWWMLAAALVARWSARVAEREATRLAALTAERQEWTSQLRGARAAGRHRLERFEVERRQLQEAEAEELATALRLYRHRAVAERLEAFALLDAELPGLGAHSTLQLLKAGIRTAGQIVDLRVSRPSGAAGGGELVQVEVPGRGLVQVEGLGRKRAQTLLDWRQSLVIRTGIALPAALSVEQEATIRLRYHARRQEIARRATVAGKRAERQEAALRERGKDERAELNLRADEVRQRAARSRGRSAALQGRASAKLSSGQLALTLARRELGAYRAVGFAAYLRAVVGLEMDH